MCLSRNELHTEVFNTLQNSFTWLKMCNSFDNHRSSPCHTFSGKNKYAGGNAVCDRPTPDWQKDISSFFIKPKNTEKENAEPEQTEKENEKPENEPVENADTEESERYYNYL